MSETSLRFRSSSRSLASLTVLASASWISTVPAVSLRTIPVTTRPSARAKIVGSKPEEILADGIEHGGDQFVARVLGSDGRELGPDGAPLLADGVALDAGQALQVAEKLAAAAALP